MIEKNENPRDLPACVGVNIRNLRKQRKISGYALAAKVGVCPSFLSRIEKNQRLRVNFTILKGIADALECSVEQIFREEGSTHMTTVEEQRYKILQLLEKVIVSEDLTHDETVRQLELILKISEKVLEDKQIA
jgi:transcriptional regulator with XRE-family HTH domain